MSEQLIDSICIYRFPYHTHAHPATCSSKTCSSATVIHKKIVINKRSALPWAAAGSCDPLYFSKPKRVCSPSRSGPAWRPPTPWAATCPRHCAVPWALARASQRTAAPSSWTALRRPPAAPSPMTGSWWRCPWRKVGRHCLPGASLSSSTLWLDPPLLSCLPDFPRGNQARLLSLSRFLLLKYSCLMASQVAQMVKNPLANAVDMDLVPGSGRSPGKSNINSLQYSCLGNPIYSPWGCKESDTTKRLSTHMVALQYCVSFCCTGKWFSYSEVKSLSRVWLFATAWTVAYKASLSIGFSRQEYWSGLPFPSPGYLPNPGIEPRSPALQAGALTSEPQGKLYIYIYALFFGFPSHLNHQRAVSRVSVLHVRFSLVSYFIHSSVYMAVPVSQFIPPLFPPWYPYDCSLCLCLCLWFYNVLWLLFSPRV